MTLDAISQAISQGGPWALLFGTWVWLLRRVATGKLVPGKIHEDRVADANKRAEIYREMAQTSLDALREQGNHTMNAITEIRAIVGALVPTPRG